MRQSQFENVWHFRCGCQRCVDITEVGVGLDTMSCPHCRLSDQLVPEETGWKCSSCGKRVSHQSADKMASQLHQLLEDEMKGSVDQLEEFLQLTSPILGRQHYVTLIAKRYLSQQYKDYKSAAQMKAKEQLCSELLQVFDALDPGLSQSRGLTLYHLSLAQLALNKMQPSHGSNSSVVRDNLSECIKCLQFEPEGSFGHKQMSNAAKLLENIGN